MEVGFLDTPGEAHGVAVSGNLAVVADGDGGLAIVRFGPQVLNTPPMAFDQVVGTTREAPVDVTLTASDVDTGDALSYIITSLPGGADLSGGGISITTVPHPLSGDTVTYTPRVHFLGSHSFTFVATDGEVESDEATVRVRVAEPVELELVGRWPYGYAFDVVERVINGTPFAFVGSGSVVLVVSHVWNRRDRAGGVSSWRPEC